MHKTNWRGGSVIIITKDRLMEAVAHLIVAVRYIAAAIWILSR